jgi:hypothetical protein
LPKSEKAMLDTVYNPATPASNNAKPAPDCSAAELARTSDVGPYVRDGLASQNSP